MSKICKFVIIFEARAGSSHLVTLLNSHPSIFCEGESLAQIYEKSWEDQLKWLNQWYAKKFKERKPISAVGMKTKLQHVLDKNEFKYFIEKEEIKVIRLYRENIISQAISAIRAHQLHENYGVWNIPKQMSDVKLDKVTVTREDISKRVRMYNNQEMKIDSFVTELRTPKVNLSYEELVNDETNSLCRLMSFLNCENSRMESSYRKATPKNLDNVIENLDELKEIISGLRRKVTYSV